MYYCHYCEVLREREPYDNKFQRKEPDLNQGSLKKVGHLRRLQ